MKKITVVFLLFSIFSYSQEDFSSQIDKQETNYLMSYFDAEKHKVLEEYDKSLMLYEKCISINPQESSAYNEIAKIYFFFKIGIMPSTTLKKRYHYRVNQQVVLLFTA